MESTHVRGGGGRGGGGGLGRGRKFGIKEPMPALKVPTGTMSSKEVTSRILKMIRPYGKAMMVVLLTTIGMELLGIEIPLMIRGLLNCIRFGDFNGLWLIAGLMLFAHIMISAGRWILIYAGHVVGYSIVADFRRMLYEHLQKLSRRFFSDASTGDLLSRSTTDINMMEPLVAHCVPSLIRCVLILICVPAIMVWLRWDLAIICALPIPIMVILVVRYVRKVQQLYGKLSERISKVMSLVSDNISGMNVIQAFTRENEEMKRFDERNENFRWDALRIMRNIGVWFGVNNFLSSFGSVLALLYGGYLVIQGQMPVEDLIAFLFYVGFFYGPVMEMNGNLDLYAQTRAGAERVFHVLDLNPDIADRPNAADIGRSTGAIEYEKVTFRYLDEIPVLDDINFKADPGQMIALVGPTGAGKSTLASLLPRFYDINQGSIKIDGKDLRDLTLRSLRQNISIVLQDVFLFNCSVRENIAFGRYDATEEEIISAAKTANAHEFILELENGYDTEIGERGVKLSGGQKQRLAIARAILKNAPILILDEATSAVDTETEALIQEALDRLMQNRTTLVIAHRLSTILHADKILVIDENRIAEQGTHDELIKYGGVYRKLYEIQFRHVTEEQKRFQQIVEEQRRPA